MRSETNGPQLYLPANVLVKWQRWREWTDEATREAWVEFHIRFCIIPNAIIDQNRGIPTIEPTRSFYTFTVIEGKREVASLCYPCVSYALRVRKEEGHALRKAVEAGTVRLVHNVEGTAAAIEDAPMPFYTQVMKMIAFVNKQYPQVLEEQRKWSASAEVNVHGEN